MESLLTQIQNLAKSVDEEARKTLLDSLRDLQYSIETPYDTLQRFGNLVCRARMRDFKNSLSVNKSYSIYK
jgi:hypothetical protein